jgi:hypothetical protein
MIFFTVERGYSFFDVFAVVMALDIILDDIKRLRALNVSWWYCLCGACGLGVGRAVSQLCFFSFHC